MLALALHLLLTVRLTQSAGHFFPGWSFPLATYDELRSLNASCDGLDTCRRAPYENLLKVNCQCGPDCVRLGTCCMDAPYAGRRAPYGGGQACNAPYGNNYGVFMVDKCPNDWEGDDSLRDLCAGDGEKRNDLMLLVPVTSPRTGVTYRNHFCFICNSVDDSRDSVISWDIGLFLANRTQYVDLSSLTFDGLQWTHPRVPPNTILGLYTNPPPQLQKKHVAYCRQNVVSSCAAGWREPLTKSKCGSYTALVSVDYLETYRNAHCAICNGAITAERSVVQCSVSPPGTGYGYSLFENTVFRDLFKIDGLPESECREGQIYDKVADKCRNVFCGIKMTMVNGRCVRRQS